MINGRRDLLPPDLFPTLWTKIEGMIAAGVIRAIDVVRDELGRKDDATKEWATTQADLFLPHDEDIQVATREVLVVHRKLVGKGGQCNLADSFVIGLARARSGIVVTQETRTKQPGETPHPGRGRGDGWLPHRGSAPRHIGLRCATTT